MKFVITLALALILTVPAVAADDTKKAGSRVIHSVGGLIGAQLYTQYMYVGVMADAYVHNAYKADVVQANMRGAIKLMENINGQLEAARKDPILSDSDRHYLKESQRVFGLLQAQCGALIAYTENKNEKTTAAFEKARKASWTSVAKMLGLNDKSEGAGSKTHD